MDYDKVDWDEKWDAGLERDDEERWFDEEEESDALELDVSVDGVLDDPDIRPIAE